VTTTDDTPADTTTAPAARPGSRIQRARMPIALDVIEAVAISHGVCIRPVTMKTVNEATGEVAWIDVPCGATLADKCPSCAERARRLRVHQCREGWHLTEDPDLTPDEPNDLQRDLATVRADVTAARDDFVELGDELSAAACAESLSALDVDLARAGVRGDIDPPAPDKRRVRSTKRRQDAPDLPKKDMADTTIGRAFTGRDGTVFRPSMFLTVTLPSYGRVRADGTPADPSTYDYTAAARDAIAFPRLLDRLVQNLRRVAGYDMQYFAAVEPQRRLTAHAHFAIRGTIPRALLKQVIAATYHQVWWPTTGTPVYDETRYPTWESRLNNDDSTAEGRAEPDHGGFIDPDTGMPITTWEQALDALDAAHELTPDDPPEPFHVTRFGAQIDVQGLLAGTPEADRRVRYLAKYLTKSMSDAHEPDTAAQKAHLDRLTAALAVEPCSPTCANWLRYGIAPKNAKEGMTPGGCKGKAHRGAHLGYAGRRILVSRKWSGKTLADHKHDRRAWVLSTLGVTDDTTTPTEPTGDRPTDHTRDRYRWEKAGRDDPIKPLAHRLLIAVAQRTRWRAAYDAAKNGEPPPTPEEVSAMPLNPGQENAA
jgi:hypothetical protein